VCLVEAHYGSMVKKFSVKKFFFLHYTCVCLIKAHYGSMVKKVSVKRCHNHTFTSFLIRSSFIRIRVRLVKVLHGSMCVCVYHGTMYVSIHTGTSISEGTYMCIHTRVCVCVCVYRTMMMIVQHMHIYRHLNKRRNGHADTSRAAIIAQIPRDTARYRHAA